MWRIPREVAWCESDDSATTYVTSIRNGRIVVLSSTAGVIWRTADGASTIEALVGRLGADLGVDGAAIAADVELCVRDLVSAGLLEVEGT